MLAFNVFIAIGNCYCCFYNCGETTFLIIFYPILILLLIMKAYFSDFGENDKMLQKM